MLNFCRSVRGHFFSWRRSLQQRRGFPLSRAGLRVFSRFLFAYCRFISLIGIIVTRRPHYYLWVCFSYLPRLTTQGYSVDVLNQLPLSRVASLNKINESKWKLFASFCTSRDLDPFSASPAVVADFLLWVARTRRASPTLAGYRSALGHVLRLTTGYCPGECRVLRQLMQSFKRTQPLPSTRIPSWDVILCY